MACSAHCKSRRGVESSARDAEREAANERLAVRIPDIVWANRLRGRSISKGGSEDAEYWEGVISALAAATRADLPYDMDAACLAAPSKLRETQQAEAALQAERETRMWREALAGNASYRLIAPAPVPAPAPTHATRPPSSPPNVAEGRHYFHHEGYPNVLFPRRDQGTTQHQEEQEQQDAWPGDQAREYGARSRREYDEAPVYHTATPAATMETGTGRTGRISIADLLLDTDEEPSTASGTRRQREFTSGSPDSDPSRRHTAGESNSKWHRAKKPRGE